MAEVGWRPLVFLDQGLSRGGVAGRERGVELTAPAGGVSQAFPGPAAQIGVEGPPNIGFEPPSPEFGQLPGAEEDARMDPGGRRTAKAFGGESLASRLQVAWLERSRCREKRIRAVENRLGRKFTGKTLHGMRSGRRGERGEKRKEGRRRVRVMRQR